MRPAALGAVGILILASAALAFRANPAAEEVLSKPATEPVTVGVILETGFLTSPRDRTVLVRDPDRAARGIARAVSQYMSPIPPVSPPAVTRPLTLRPHRTLSSSDADQAR